MKEAAGEANLTVIAILLIAIVAAVGTPLIKSLINSSAEKACCANAGGTWEDGSCSKNSGWDDTNKECK